MSRCKHGFARGSFLCPAYCDRPGLERKRQRRLRLALELTWAPSTARRKRWHRENARNPSSRYFGAEQA